MSLALFTTVLALMGVLLCERRGLRLGVFILKPIASAGFVAGAVFAGVHGPVESALFAGLVLSWWGDVLLIPKSKRWFLAGLIAFLLGHIGFLAAFLLHGIAPNYGAIGCIGVAILAIPIGRWLLPQVDDKLRGAVLAYLVVISFMVAAAIGAAGDGASHWLPIAAFLFFLSDLSVAIDRFVRPSFANRLWGLPLYYAAQWIFVLAIMN